jgi:formate dehydrogenase subunit delta
MAPTRRRANAFYMDPLKRGHAPVNDTKLVTMVNQIAAFHRRRPAAEAATEVAAHVEKFWEARMRRAIYAHLDHGGEGLDPNALAGLRLLRAREEGKLPFDPYAKADLSSPLEA